MLCRERNPPPPHLLPPGEEDILEGREEGEDGDSSDNVR
jgi:hypothetical protein